MKFEEKNPPRHYRAGFENPVTIADCGRAFLESDEQITFCAGTSEYDVTRKDWGYYATPSLNGRLPSFGLKSFLARNREGRFYILLVHEGKEEDFQEYCRDEKLQPLLCLSDEKDLKILEKVFS
jgi:hypothetical protein